MQRDSDDLFDDLFAAGEQLFILRFCSSQQQQQQQKQYRNTLPYTILHSSYTNIDRRSPITYGTSIKINLTRRRVRTFIAYCIHTYCTRTPLYNKHYTVQVPTRSEYLYEYGTSTVRVPHRIRTSIPYRSTATSYTVRYEYRRKALVPYSYSYSYSLCEVTNSGYREDTYVPYLLYP